MDRWRSDKAAAAWGEQQGRAAELFGGWFVDLEVGKVFGMRRMPRFFLDIQNGAGGAEDQDGMECDSFEDAHTQAIRGIRSLLAAELFDGRFDLNGTLTILDEHRRTGSASL